MANSKPDEVRIGKFDLLATYMYARARLDGLPEVECKERGLVAALMGARPRLGSASGDYEDHQLRKEAAERKKKTRITAGAFDRQVAHKFGEFFPDVFVPTLEDLIEAGLFYDEVEKLVQIPATWGATISGEEFEDRAADRIDEGGDDRPDDLP